MRRYQRVIKAITVSIGRGQGRLVDLFEKLWYSRLIGKHIRQAQNRVNGRTSADRLDAEEISPILEKLLMDQRMHSDDISTLLMDMIILGVQAVNIFDRFSMILQWIDWSRQNGPFLKDLGKVARKIFTSNYELGLFCLAFRFLF